MNRKLMCAVLACGTALFAGSAMAADLPSRVAAPVPYLAPPPVFTWSGFYVGVVAGASFGSGNNNSQTFTPSANLPGSPNLNPNIGSNGNNTNFTGGGELGYNYQFNNIVLGLEGDVDYLGRRNGNNNGTFQSPAFYTAFPTYTLAGSSSSNNRVFGTIRGRLGYAVDRALFFVTGGVAFGGENQQPPSSLAFNNTAGVPCGSCVFNSTGNNNNNSTVGAVVGGGIEYAFTPNWTAKVEYLRTLYGRKNNTTVYANNAGQTFTLTGRGFNEDTNIVRVGLNYKF